MIVSGDRRAAIVCAVVLVSCAGSSVVRGITSMVNSTRTLEINSLRCGECCSILFTLIKEAMTPVTMDITEIISTFIASNTCNEIGNSNCKETIVTLDSPVSDLMTTAVGVDAGGDGPCGVGGGGLGGLVGVDGGGGDGGGGGGDGGGGVVEISVAVVTVGVVVRTFSQLVAPSDEIIPSGQGIHSKLCA